LRIAEYQIIVKSRHFFILGRGKKKKNANAQQNAHVNQVTGLKMEAVVAPMMPIGSPGTPGSVGKPFFPGRRLPSLATIARECENGKPKTHFCEHCHRGFSSGYHLTRHQKIHMGEYPAVCPECGKTFRDASSLKRHNFVHTKDSPHECPVCKKRFGEIAR
jgi:hypothetical protein